MRAAVGYADGRARPDNEIDPEDVSMEGEDGVRYFHDGAMAGMLRSLRSRKVIGNFVHDDGTVDDEVFVVEPDFSGGFVPRAECAAEIALQWASLGFYVIAGVLLAYDTPFPQYLWKSRTASPATETKEFAVLLAPGQAAEARALAFKRDSGGGG